MGFWWENMEERVHLKYPDVDGRILLKWIFKTCDGSRDWIDLAQDRDRWWAVENAVMNFGFHETRKIS